MFSFLHPILHIIVDAETHKKGVHNPFDTVIIILDLEAVVLDVGCESTLEL